MTKWPMLLFYWSLDIGLWSLMNDVLSRLQTTAGRDESGEEVPLPLRRIHSAAYHGQLLAVRQQDGTARVRPAADHLPAPRQPHRRPPDRYRLPPARPAGSTETAGCGGRIPPEMGGSLDRAAPGVRVYLHLPHPPEQAARQRVRPGAPEGVPPRPHQERG